VSPVTRTRWVTFDCYGTLVDWQGGFASILSRIAGERVDDLVRAYHRWERRVVRAPRHASYKEVLASALRMAADETAVSLPAPDVRALSLSWKALRPFDDVEAALARLRAKGYKLAVLTNCDDDLFEVTHRTFRKPFDLFVTAERIRGYKPAPWHFRGFELMTRARKADWVHVSSSVYHDIAPAQAYGVKSVWLDRGRGADNSAAGTVRVHSASEIVGAIEDLFERPVGDRRSAARAPQLC
jgi:2-haloacid dehalogenase